jgi:cytochrome P450
LISRFSFNFTKLISIFIYLLQCILFFLAGYETTASTLTFCSYELALNPHVQEKLLKEVKAVANSDGDIDYETLVKLPYLDAVLSETLVS